VFGPGTPAKEINSTSADLAGTGTGHEETNSPALNQAMDFIQKLGQTLNFIDDNQMVLWGYLLCDPSGILTKRQKNRSVQKIIYSHFFQGMVDQGCLAGLTGSKKEMRLLNKERRQIQNPLNIRGISVFSSYWRFHRHIGYQMTIDMSIIKLCCPIHSEKFAIERLPNQIRSPCALCPAP